MSTSKKIDINGKNVDFNIRNDANIITSDTNDPNHGIINAVVYDDENDEDKSGYNALYVGSAHIASGYGLHSPATVNAVEELLSNPNVQKLLIDEQSSIDIEIDDNPSSGTISVPEVSFNNISLKILNGLFVAKTWINIYNIELVLSNGNKLYEGQTYEYSMLENSLYIKKINLVYDIKNSSNEIKYNINFTYQGLPQNNLEIFNNGTTINVTADGIKHQISIDCNILIPRENELNYMHPINLLLSNNDSYSFINICNIKYKYPIFITTTESLSGDYKSSLYDTIGGAEISIKPNDPTYIYVWVPEVLNEIDTQSEYKEGFVCILKSSNIGCKFTTNSNSTRINTLLNSTDQTISYVRYKSPWMYSGKMTWIIK